ncbi:MAG: DUF420 domain-containing protein [Bacteroidetes bacterium]|nr:DUF420 domain-containing protein [Bacteroidota bacterium]
MVNSKTSAIPANEKTILRLIYIVSIVVFLAVAALGRMPKAESIPEWAKILPALNATLNAITTLLLIVSFYFIRKKNVQMHKKLNLTACVLSTILLLSYITFHAFGVETSFPKDNPVRPFYLILLSTHIVLAAIVLPLVLISLYRGLSNQVSLHRKIVRWSFPVWLYVTTTGVIVYLMISPHYKF